MTKAKDISREAYANFAEWVAANDPDGEMGLLEQLDTYAAWWRGQEEIGR